MKKLTNLKVKVMASLLKHGLAVDIDGTFYKAIQISTEVTETPCHTCPSLKSCSRNVFNVCCEIEDASHHWWRLVPVDQNELKDAEL